MVAKPSNPGNLAKIEEVQGTEIDQAFIGSCTNGRMEDLYITAKILKGKKIDSRVRLIIIPASKEIRLRSRVKSKSVFTPTIQIKNESDHTAHVEREDKTAKVRQPASIPGDILVSDVLNSIKKICENCPRLPAVLSTLNRSS